MTLFNKKNFFKKKWIIYDNLDNLDNLMEEGILLIDIKNINVPKDTFSLTKYVYQDRNVLTKIYFSRVKIFLNKVLKKINLEDKKNFQIHSMPYIEISAFTENCVLRNPNLTLYLQTIALEKLIDKYKPEKIEFHNIKQIIIDSLQKRKFNHNLLLHTKYMNIKNTKIPIPYLLSAISRWFVLLYQIIILKIFFKNNYKKNKLCHELLLVSYSSDINYSKKKVISKYWNILITYLQKHNVYTELLYIHTSASNTSRHKILNWYRYYNLKNNNFDLSTFDEYLNIKNLFLTIIYFVKIKTISSKLEYHFNNFNNEAEKIYPWPFLKDNWYRYTQGGTAINYIIQILQIHDFILNSKFHKKVIYCWEGMLWEKVFTYYWKKYKSTPVYGYQHTIIKSGDMRGKKNHLNKNSNNFYPNKLLFTGDIFRSSLMFFDYKLNEIIAVESLRFLYLKNLKIENNNNKVIHMLLLEGNEVADKFLLLCFQFLVESDIKKENVFFFIKTHPNTNKSLITSSIKKNNINIYMENIEKALSFSTYVYTSINSSVAFESYILNKKLILIQIPGVLIRTAIPALNWDKIITKKEEIINYKKYYKKNINNEILFLDQKLAKWQFLLK